MTNQLFKPQHDTGELDEAEEIGGELVVPSGDAPPLLKLGEEALDAPSLLIGDAVVAVLVVAVAAAR